MRIDGDHAVANSYSIVLRHTEHGIELVNAGTNRWVLRREGGRWRIQERKQHEVGAEDTDEAFDLFSKRSPGACQAE